MAQNPRKCPKTSVKCPKIQGNTLKPWEVPQNPGKCPKNSQGNAPKKSREMPQNQEKWPKTPGKYLKNCQRNTPKNPGKCPKNPGKCPKTTKGCPQTRGCLLPKSDTNAPKFRKNAPKSGKDSSQFRVGTPNSELPLQTPNLGTLWVIFGHFRSFLTPNPARSQLPPLTPPNPHLGHFWVILGHF